jgi:hypothetical protein
MVVLTGQTGRPSWQSICLTWQELVSARIGVFLDSKQFSAGGVVKVGDDRHTGFKITPVTDVNSITPLQDITKSERVLIDEDAVTTMAMSNVIVNGSR